MNIKVHFAHTLWYIVLCKPLYSSITQLWAASYPPLQRNSGRIGTPQCLLALLSLNWSYSMPFCTQFRLFQYSSTGIGTPESPLSGLPVVCYIPCSILLLLALILYYWALIPRDTYCSIPISAPLLGLALALLYLIPCSIPHFRHSSARFGRCSTGISTPQSPSVLLNLDWSSSVSFHAPPTPSLYSSFNTALPIWRTLIPSSCFPFPSECIILPVKPPLWFGTS